jgi:dTDP-4-dehydrorhamnose 3,5-epimerase
MIIVKTELRGLFVLEIEPRVDERGYFARTFCAREFAEAGLPTLFVQSNLSVNSRKGTLRGMHFQRAPAAEGKLVTCARGRIHDVVVDIRRNSPTYGKWAAFDLSQENRRLLYIPPGFAHGFQTLEDETDVLYQMTEFYRPEMAGGFRWNDMAFAIKWPLSDMIVSEKDRAFADFEL